MSSLHPQTVSRRLPVFFLLDTSQHMDGVYQVTLQQGLAIFKHGMLHHAPIYSCIHTSCITFGTTAASTPLQSFLLFKPPSWQSRGESSLKPALDILVESFSYDLIISCQNRLGDYPPLVFIILGNEPVDDWKNCLQMLRQLKQPFFPLLIALTTQRQLALQLKKACQYVLLLQPVRAEGITDFFTWAVECLLDLYNQYQYINGVAVPSLPTISSNLVHLI